MTGWLGALTEQSHGWLFRTIICAYDEGAVAAGGEVRGHCIHH
jgi:hypothetical protein